MGDLGITLEGDPGNITMQIAEQVVGQIDPMMKGLALYGLSVPTVSFMGYPDSILLELPITISGEDDLEMVAEICALWRKYHQRKYSEAIDEPTESA